MNDEDPFLQAILNSPIDAFPRFVYADWLDEQNDPRGELLRLLHALTQIIDIPQRKHLEHRLRFLLESGVKPVGPFITNRLGMKFALIPPGTFMMGSPTHEKGRRRDEYQHKVTLTRPFYLAIHPVTQLCWQNLMGYNPSHFKGDELPVEKVSWEDCQEFLKKLTEADGYSYRLPTEAEWEYACRAGTTTPYYFGEKITAKQASFNDPRKIMICKFPPNAWGLYDMHGTVWEWCSDWYGHYPEMDVADPTGPESGSCRVLRGGSFLSQPSLVRSASRSSYSPTTFSFPHRLSYGIRAVMEVS
jgi:formylglycine-generating enzyme